MKTTIRKGKELSQIGEQALVLLKSRYLAKNDSGQVVETPEGMYRRVAVAIAATERLYGATAAVARHLASTFYSLMIRGVFLPNSPTLMNAGRLSKALLSACCVLPVRDSIRGIRDATPNGVKDVFLAAYDLDCKGITVYREGSRSNQPMDHVKAASVAPKGRGCSCSECAIA